MNLIIRLIQGPTRIPNSSESDPSGGSAHREIISTPETALFNRILAGLLVVWLAAVLMVNLPGHLSVDSMVQISEGRTGVVQSWNPLFSSWVFGRLVALTGGTEIIVALSALMLGASLYGLLKASPGRRIWGLMPTAVLLFAPVLLIYPGIVWKDVWFAHACVAAFALIALRAQGAGWWTEAMALSMLAVAMLSRQTGLIVCGVAILAMTAIRHTQARRSGSASAWRAVVGATVRVAVMLAMASGFSATARSTMKQVDGAEVGTGLRLVAIFDIAGMLQRLPDASLDRLRAAGFDTAAWERAARVSYSGERIDTLDLPPISGPTDLTAGMLWGQWADLTLRHPVTYVAHRWGTHRWFLGLENPARCLPVQVGIDPPERAEQAGLRPVPSRWSGQLYSYSRSFLKAPYFVPLVWNGVALLVLIVWIRRGRWDDPILWMQVAGLAYSASYFIAGLSCDFRYSYCSVLTASIGLMRLFTDGLSVSRPQHP